MKLSAYTRDVSNGRHAELLIKSVVLGGAALPELRLTGACVVHAVLRSLCLLFCKLSDFLSPFRLQRKMLIRLKGGLRLHR
jgi:hypothetical protein